MLDPNFSSASKFTSSEENKLIIDCVNYSFRSSFQLVLEWSFVWMKHTILTWTTHFRLMNLFDLSLLLLLPLLFLLYIYFPFRCSNIIQDLQISCFPAATATTIVDFPRRLCTIWRCKMFILTLFTFLSLFFLIDGN